MSTVVMERRREVPLTLEGLAGEARAGSWCLDMYRVVHQLSVLSRDGRRIVCVFDAPDAEAVRTAVRQAGDEPERVWPATGHAPPGEATSGALRHAEVVVVERDFDAPAAFETLQAREEAGAWCLRQYRVRFLRTYFSADRRRMLCLYDAPDAEAVRLAQAQADMPLSAVWAGWVFPPP